MTATAPQLRRPERSPRLRRYPGIARVAKELAALVDRERVSPRVKRLAVRLAVEGGLKRTPDGHPDLRDRRGMAEAILRGLRRRVNYANDPEKTEVVNAPLTTLTTGLGDCEDFVAAGGSMLSSLGVPVQIVLVGYGADGYDHTYLEVDAGDGWEAWDATLEGARFGMRAPGERRRHVVAVAEAARFGLAGAPRRRFLGDPDGSRSGGTTVIDARLSVSEVRTLTVAPPPVKTQAQLEAEAERSALDALGYGRPTYVVEGQTYRLPRGLDQTGTETLRLVIEGDGPATVGGVRYSWSGGRLWTGTTANGPALRPASPASGGVLNCLVPPCPQPGAAPPVAPTPATPPPPAAEASAPVTVLGLPLPVALGVGALGVFLVTRPKKS